MTPIPQAFAVGAIVIGAAIGAVSVMGRDIPDLAVPEGPWQASSALDGRVFYTVDRIADSDDVLHDELHFVDGRFQSAMCQKYCDFGWSDYQVKQVNGALQFTATTRCPHAPHTVVWYGTVDDDSLRFQGTWTTRRWYWTHQIYFEGRGTSTAPAGPVSGT
ncbi:hypothetical protein [Amaricoccus tamworthensis]|uniref:hypothetical protein n=1 Tax=Amaricoccus tamworthensis TaxID=57002 RepID=UPI003C7B8588